MTHCRGSWGAVLGGAVSAASTPSAASRQPASAAAAAPAGLRSISVDSRPRTCGRVG